MEKVLEITEQNITVKLEVESVSFDLHRDPSFVGPNGAGKSTVIRTIMD